MAPRPPWCITLWSNFSTTAGVETSMSDRPLLMADNSRRSDDDALRGAVELIGGIEYPGALLYPGVIDAGVQRVNDGQIPVRAIRRFLAEHLQPAGQRQA